MSDPHKAVDYIIKNAGKFAQAKANRVYLEEYRKSKKALLMGQSSLDAANAREQYAYAHEEYRALLKAMQTAIEAEEKLRWDLIAAQARIDIWRTEQANNRMQDRAAR
jgi:hypothetical protein